MEISFPEHRAPATVEKSCLRCGAHYWGNPQTEITHKFSMFLNQINIGLGVCSHTLKDKLIEIYAKNQ